MDQCLDKVELLAHQEDENAGCGGDLPLEDYVNGDADYDGGGGGEEDIEEFDPSKNFLKQIYIKFYIRH